MYMEGAGTWFNAQSQPGILSHSLLCPQSPTNCLPKVLHTVFSSPFALQILIPRFKQQAANGSPSYNCYKKAGLLEWHN